MSHITKSKNSFTLVLMSVLLVFICIDCQTKKEEAKIPKSVFIIVDGIPADVIEKLNPPVLKEISQHGGFTRAYVGGSKDAYSESPTISAVGYHSLLTGTWSNKHNVWDNDIVDPNYNYWSIFRIAKENNPNIKTAIFSTWLDNRTKLVGEGLPQTGQFKFDYVYDGLEHDTINFPHGKDRLYIQQIDEAVSSEAASVISTNGPDLSWVYLEFTDDMGHQFGDSPEFYDAIVATDKQIGKIWEAIKEREKKFNEDWLIVITTDHGRNAETGKNHGGQSERERATWIVTNAKERNEHFHQQPGVVDILPSLCHHLMIELPTSLVNEIDGVPFIGSIDIADLRGEISGDTIQLNWKSFHLSKEERVEILVSETNNFKTGGVDNYQKVGEATLQQEKFEFKPTTSSDFYKIVVATPHQRTNVWIFR